MSRSPYDAVPRILLYVAIAGLVTVALIWAHGFDIKTRKFNQETLDACLHDLEDMSRNFESCIRHAAHCIPEETHER